MVVKTKVRYKLPHKSVKTKRGRRWSRLRSDTKVVHFWLKNTSPEVKLVHISSTSEDINRSKTGFLYRTSYRICRGPLKALDTTTMMSDTDSGDSTPAQKVTEKYLRLQRQYQQVLDRLTPFILNRWLSTAGLLCVFMLRIVLSQGVSPSRVNAVTYLTDAYSGT